MDPATMSLIASQGAPILKDGLAKAEKAATKAVNDALKALKCKLYPCRCVVQRRAISYRTTAEVLITEAKDAADAGDWVSAYTLADAAGALRGIEPFASYFTSSGSKPPNCTWETGGQTAAKIEAVAGALSDAYEANATSQAQAGGGGGYRVKTGPDMATLAAVGGGLAILAILASRGGRS